MKTFPKISGGSWSNLNALNSAELARRDGTLLDGDSASGKESGCLRALSLLALASLSPTWSQRREKTLSSPVDVSPDQEPTTQPLIRLDRVPKLPICGIRCVKLDTVFRLRGWRWRPQSLDNTRISKSHLSKRSCRLAPNLGHHLPGKGTGESLHR